MKIVKDAYYLGLLILSINFLGIHCKNAIDFKRDIPDFKNGKSETLLGLQMTADSLKLPRLENGFDSMAIRVWFSYSGKDTVQVLTIKNSDGVWSGQFNQGAYALNRNQDSIHYTQKKEWALDPKIGWRSLVDSIIGQDILTLPDNKKIMSINEFPLDGGNSVTIEISTKSAYRLYFYQMPNNFKEKYREAKKVENILNILARQLLVNYLDII